MEINWPIPGSIGEQYTSPNGDIWEWNGYAWEFIGSGEVTDCDIIPISEETIFSILSGTSPSPGLKVGCKYRIYDAGVSNGAPGSSTDDGASGFITIATSPTSIDPNGTWQFVTDDYSKMVLVIGTNHDPIGTYSGNSISDIVLDGSSIISTSHPYTPGPGNIQDLLDSISNDINTLPGGTWEAVNNSWTSSQNPIDSVSTDIGLIYLRSKIAGERNNLVATISKPVVPVDSIAFTYSSISALGSIPELISLDANYDHISKNITKAYDPVTDVTVSNDFGFINDPMIYDFPWRVRQSSPRTGSAVTTATYAIMSSSFRNCASVLKRTQFNYIAIYESTFHDTVIGSNEETGAHVTIENTEFYETDLRLSNVLNVIGSNPREPGLGIQIYSSKIKQSTIYFDGYYTTPSSDFYVSGSNIEGSNIFIGNSGSTSSPSTSNVTSSGSPIYFIDSLIKKCNITINDTYLVGGFIDFTSLDMWDSTFEMLGGVGNTNYFSSTIEIGGNPGKGFFHTSISSSYIAFNEISWLGGALDFVLQNSIVNESSFILDRTFLPENRLNLNWSGMEITGSLFNLSSANMRYGFRITLNFSQGGGTAGKWIDSNFILSNLNILEGSRSSINFYSWNSTFFNTIIDLSEMTLDLLQPEAGVHEINLSYSEFFDSSLSLERSTLKADTGQRNQITVRGILRYSSIFMEDITFTNSSYQIGNNEDACWLDSSTMRISAFCEFIDCFLTVQLCKLTRSFITVPTGTITDKGWSFSVSEIYGTTLNLINGTNATNWSVQNCRLFNVSSIDFSDSTSNSTLVTWKNMSIDQKEVTINLNRTFTSSAGGTTNTAFYVPRSFNPYQVILGDVLNWVPSPISSPVTLSLDTAGTFSNNINEDVFDALSTAPTVSSALIKSSASECEYINFSSTTEVGSSTLDLIIKGRIL